jgi:mono/diheme cytochrome c family protein
MMQKGWKMKTSKLLSKGVAALATGCVFTAVVTSAALAQDAKQVYEKNCQACHGPAGKGDGPAGKMLKPPPADFATGLKGQSDADVAKIIKEGGKAVGKAASMPAYGSKLKDDEISALVKYIKTLK